LLNVVVGNDFAHKKNLFLTGFAHNKLGLWKSCGLGLRFGFSADLFRIWEVEFAFFIF
jgi:hypothetical protein